MSDTNDQLIKSVRSANPSLLSVQSWSLFPSAKTFHAVIVLYSEDSSRISTFDTSGSKWHWNPNHCHCLVWVILSFHFTVIRLTKSGSQGMDYRSKFPLHGIILCLEQAHTYLLATRQKRFVELNPYCVLEQTHVYLLATIQERFRIEPLCVLEQGTHISTCNQTEMVVEWTLMCSRTDTYTSTCNRWNGCRMNPMVE